MKAGCKQDICLSCPLRVSIIMSRLNVSKEKSPTTSIASSSVVGRLYCTGSPSLAPTILITNSSLPWSFNLSLASLNFFANGLCSSNIFIKMSTIDGSKGSEDRSLEFKAASLLLTSFVVSYMYNCMNFGEAPSGGSKEPIRWWTCPQILKTGGPRPSLMEESIFAPIDVKANRQLYCLMFRMNLSELESPSNLANELRGSGRDLYDGMLTLPPLQQLL